ncbi:uncharacterized protein LOC105703810 [Orussus abietinus]|uniref:uncharacterized protein LOC105703810 n=1 Tax=Orussus abietinus TaxID=222816 RepID=UPI0006261529|nr:uncharacterized protein LOC105703810 [Orussus abietinus]
MTLKPDLEEQGVTSRKIDRLVRRALEKSNRKIVTVKIQQFSAEKVGYLGLHLHVRVITLDKDSSRKDTQEFFVKTIPYHNVAQVYVIEERNAFSKEVIFFDKLVPLMMEGYDGEPWCATCYATEEDTLVLDDLRTRGFTNRSGLFDEELVKSALSCMARFHASSLLTEHRLQKKLMDMYPRAFEEGSFLRTGKIYQWFKAGVDLAVTIAKKLGLDPAEIPRACEEVFRTVEPSPTKKNVICHADIWSSNLVFDKSSPPKCRIVDFQLIRYSPPVQDVICFMYLTTNRDFRKAQEVPMLRHYYSTLVETMKANNASVEVPTWSEIVTAMEEQRLGAVVSAVIFYPTVLMDRKIATKIFGDPESYANFVYNDRRSTVLEIMKSDMEYAKRIEEAVKELHEFSTKIDHLAVPT